MSIFGKGFIGGIWLLRILAIGQFINAVTGSVGYILTMSGHEKDIRNIAILNGAKLHDDRDGSATFEYCVVTSRTSGFKREQTDKLTA